MQCCRLGLDNLGCFSQSICRLPFALGMDDFGSLLSFRLSLFGHSPLHCLRQENIFNFYQGCLDSLGGFTLFINNLPQPQVYLVTVSQQLIQI